MNYLKTSLAGLAVTVAALGGVTMANAQAVAGSGAVGYGNASNSIIIPTGSSSVTAVGTADSPVIYIPGGTAYAPSGAASLTTAQAASLGYDNPAPLNNYSTGYYNYNTLTYPAAYASSSAAYNGYTSNGYNGATAAAYPGAPSTGGPITAPTSATAATTASGSTDANGNRVTYIPPTMYNGQSYTGGVSVPTGTALPTGSTSAYTNSANGYATTPSGGFTASNGNGANIAPNGLVRVNGVVSTVTPTAIGLSNGSQTWAIRWDNGTTVSSSNGTNSNGSQISVGNSLEVTGYPDPTYASQIDATAITDLSSH